ncbi:MAG: sigma-54 interaction domain-containing protein [Desulfitobacteriaceae bacterium]
MSVGANAVTSKVIRQWNQKILFDILDMIHDVVLVIDSDTTIVYANKAYAEILGVPVQKVLGRRLDKIEPGTAVIQVLRTGEVLHNHRSYLSSVGIDVVGSMFPLYEGSQIIGSVAVFKNVSEVVRLTQELHRTKGVADYLQEQLDQREALPISFKEYIGQNSRLSESLLLAAKVARTDSTVLIRGESGVGKEVLAKAIHNSSRRCSKPLIKVNCAAIPENLLESELFGYEDGAFTGSKKGGKMGKFELAHGGTIFLDEIGDMSTNMQAKLLRVLQEREIERVGGNKTIRLDIRVVAATNRDLDEMMDQGTFRRDLYYRLNIVPLNLPPLRERKDDIPALTEYYLKKFGPQFDNPELAVSPATMDLLQEYDWPGNIRELQNVLEHAAIVSSGAYIEPKHLPAHLWGEVKSVHRAQANNYGIKDAVARMERELIVAALENANGNRSQAMRALGISRRAFYDKMRRYSIDDER